MNTILDRFASKGLQQQLLAALFLALALGGFASTICAKANGAEPLNVSAIAGRPTAVSTMPPLNVSAIARNEPLCTCPGCRCETPHQCGDPGCTCASTRAELPALNLSQLSPRRAAQDKPREPADPKPTNQAEAKPKPQAKPSARQPHYELRNVCNGGYCVRQWVLVQ